MPRQGSTLSVPVLLFAVAALARRVDGSLGAQRRFISFDKQLAMMSNPLDSRKQTKNHPWLILGGSLALGLLIRRLTTAKKPVRPVYDGIEAPQGVADKEAFLEQATSMHPVSPPRETAWDLIKQSALTALASAFTELATRVAPMVLDRSSGQRPDQPPPTGDPDSSEPVLTPDDEQIQGTRPEKDL